MDRELNSRFEKATIYEIYRGCRLCGAGAGYKMPIVQNVVDLDESGVKLSQKIRECVQIEVHQDDKMPPLICELCVDKVNDFYEFLEMCRQTNKQTRLKLGLPLQSSSSGSEFESSNCCILGMTDPVYVNDDSDTEPLSKHTSKPRLKERHKEESPRRELRLRNIKDMISKDEIITPSSVRITRTSSIIKQERTSSSLEDDEIPLRVTRTLSSLHQQKKPSVQQQEALNKSKAGNKPGVNKIKEYGNGGIKIVDETSFFNGRKRSLGVEDKSTMPSKKVRISTDAPKPTTRATSQASKPPAPETHPRSSSRTSSHNSHQRPQRMKRSPSPAPSSPSPTPSDTTTDFFCPICHQANRTMKGYYNHIRVHVANFTNNKLACNPCGEWFLNYNETQAHHRLHKFKGLPYRCRRCSAEFEEIDVYNTHLTNGECIPYDIVPDVKCEMCWRYFATDNLLIEHRCAGEDGRPGGKCNKCNRTYVLLKNLKRHESVCKHKRKNNLIVEPEVMESLKPVHISLVRCDNLLTEKQREFLTGSFVTQNRGLDNDYVYPYISSVKSLKVKCEPIDDDYNCMVDINDTVKKFLTEEDCIDWDSGADDNDTKKYGSVVNKKQRVDTLAALALKAVVSQRFLGKVPKKYRKIRVNKMFDSLGEFGVKNVDKLLERLDDVDTIDGKEECIPRDVKNEDSAGDKSANCVSVGVSGEEIKENDSTCNNNEYVENSHNGALESSNKMDSNDQEDNQNVNNETDRSEEDNLRENSNYTAQIDIQRNESVKTGNHSDNNDGSDGCNDREYKNIEERTGTAVGLNAHNSEDLQSNAVEERLSCNFNSLEILKKSCADSNEKFILNNVTINTEIEDNKLINALEEQIDSNEDSIGNDNTQDINPKEIFNQNNEFDIDIGKDKSDLSANGRYDKQKITLEDLLENKVVAGNTPSLDRISEDEYNFDI